MNPSLPPPTTEPYAGRRRELVVAAERVVADGGLRALTHRAVDAQAGLPEGSCSTSFRTRLALLTALTEHVGHQLTTEVLDLAERLRDSRAGMTDRPAALASVDASVGAVPAAAGAAGDGVALDETRRAEVIALVVTLFDRLLDAPGLVLVHAELALEARRQPELQAVLGPWRTGLVGIVEAIVAEAGKPDPAQRALTLVAAMEGVVLAGLQEPASTRTAYLRTATGMLLGGLY